MQYLRAIGAGLAAFAAVLSSAQAIAQADNGQCMAAATKDYLATTMALTKGELAMATPHATVEMILTRRRLEEQYCLRLAKCVHPDISSAEAEFDFSTMFSTCLKDQGGKPD